MVWGFTLKGEAIFENAFTLYVKFAFNYFSQRIPAGEWDEGAEVELDVWRRPWGAESVGDESHLETVSET
ncbi:hypothetical protein GPL15_11440 [Clostridium sp. MCC353]|uniref:hypothetical protein n=1 Tax=Clostridium sp. MCC353 TaxID=2592646 RepID=UPI001C01E812|nr:hypothetical protein [Clostridium sp. MCC353]MBT9777115.1 hypothetical protein [Clostridium sp. MCC353]